MVLLTSAGSSIVIAIVGRMLQLIGPHHHGRCLDLTLGSIAVNTAERLLPVWQETLTL